MALLMYIFMVNPFSDGPVGAKLYYVCFWYVISLNKMDWLVLAHMVEVSRGSFTESESMIKRNFKSRFI